MMKKVGFLVILSIIIFTLFIVGGYVYLTSNTAPESTKQENKEVTQQADALLIEFSLPQFSPDFTWDTQIIDDAYLKTTPGNPHEIFVRTSLGTKTYQPTGFFYTTEASYDETSEGTKDQLIDFYNSYQKSLTDLGWKEKVTFQDKTISPLASGGPVGETVGFIKQSDDGTTITTVLLSRSEVGGIGGIVKSCPCKYMVSIFVSQPMLISDVIKNAK